MYGRNTETFKNPIQPIRPLTVDPTRVRKYFLFQLLKYSFHSYHRSSASNDIQMLKLS